MKQGLRTNNPQVECFCLKLFGKVDSSVRRCWSAIGPLAECCDSAPFYPADDGVNDSYFRCQISFDAVHFFFSSFFSFLHFITYDIDWIRIIYQFDLYLYFLLFFISYLLTMLD